MTYPGGQPSQQPQKRLQPTVALAICFAVLLAACGEQTADLLGSQADEPITSATSRPADSSNAQSSGGEAPDPDSAEDAPDTSADKNGSEEEGEARANASDNAPDNLADTNDSQSDEPPTRMSTDLNEAYQLGTCYFSSFDSDEPKLVDCEAAHDVEVYHVDELSGADGSPFQDIEQARALCDPAFREIAGINIGLATIFDGIVLKPSEETWGQGDRAVTCLIQYPEPVVGSLGEIDPLRGFGFVSPYGMQVGDCFAEFDDVSTRFNLISCDETFDVEVFVDETLTDNEFPGEDAVEARADELCFGSTFDEFVGKVYRDSNLFSLRSMPTERSWEQGDRTINCLLTTDEPRTGSFKNSRL